MVRVPRPTVVTSRAGRGWSWSSSGSPPPATGCPGDRGRPAAWRRPSGRDRTAATPMRPSRRSTAADQVPRRRRAGRRRHRRARCRPAILALVVLALVSTSRSLFERSRRIHEPPDDEPDEHWPAPRRSSWPPSTTGWRRCAPGASTMPSSPAGSDWRMRRPRPGPGVSRRRRRPSWRLASSPTSMRRPTPSTACCDRYRQRPVLPPPARRGRPGGGHRRARGDPRRHRRSPA